MADKAGICFFFEGHRTPFLCQPYDQSEIKALIGICNIFYGSRLHSCIAALSQSIPTVGISYSTKFKGVYESLQIQDYIIDACSKSQAEIIQMALDFYAQKDQIANKLKKIIPEVQLSVQHKLEEALSIQVS